MEFRQGMYLTTESRDVEFPIGHGVVVEFDGLLIRIYFVFPAAGHDPRAIRDVVMLAPGVIASFDSPVETEPLNDVGMILRELCGREDEIFRGLVSDLDELTASRRRDAGLRDRCVIEMRVIDEHDGHKNIIAFFAEQEECEAGKGSNDAGMMITS